MLDAARCLRARLRLSLVCGLRFYRDGSPFYFSKRNAFSWDRDSTKESTASVSPPHAVDSPRRVRTIANVKQKPLFAGPHKPIINFEGESVYRYRVHALCMFRDSLALMVLPGGCLLAYLGSFSSVIPVVPLAVKVAYLLALGILSRFLAMGPRNNLQRDLIGWHVVITGGTSGVGRATAAQLARLGADITIVSLQTPDHVEAALQYIRAHCRHPIASPLAGDSDIGEKVPQLCQRIEFHALDLSNFIAVRDFCKRLRRESRPIDILINNAAVMSNSHTTTRLGVDMQLAVNHLGPFLLTEGLLPLVEAVRGRIIYVSCSSHVSVKQSSLHAYLTGPGTEWQSAGNRFDSFKQYGLTKLACIYHAQDLAARSYQRASKSTLAGVSAPVKSKPRGVLTGCSSSAPKKGLRGDKGNSAPPRFTTCVCSPGAAITNLYRSVPISLLFRFLYYPFLAFMRTAWDGSQTVVNCALQEELCNGGYYANTRYQPRGLSEAACSPALREQMMVWTRNTMQPYMHWNQREGRGKAKHGGGERRP